MQQDIKRKHSVGWAQPDQYPLKTRKHRLAGFPHILFIARVWVILAAPGDTTKGLSLPIMDYLLSGAAQEEIRMESFPPCLSDGLPLQPQRREPTVSLVRRREEAGWGRQCWDATGVDRGGDLLREGVTVAFHARWPLSPLLFSRVLYGNKITEIAKGLFDGLVSLQLLWVGTLSLILSLELFTGSFLQTLSHAL